LPLCDFFISQQTNNPQKLNDSHLNFPPLGPTPEIYYILPMLFIIAIAAAAVGSALIFGAYQYLQRSTASAMVGQRQELDAQIAEVGADIEKLLVYKDSYASRLQYQQLAGTLSSLKADLENDREKLKGLESKLDEAQTTVELKESHQQEVKSSHEEDEEKLESLMDQYQAISDESIALEQDLAQSMKNLDALMADVNFSEEHKEILDALSEALSMAGETLRNLLTDYQSVNERLTLLREQHTDLEDEYTKLVEQQLGE
jgi:chromosome segregation ATPase